MVMKAKAKEFNRGRKEMDEQPVGSMKSRHKRIGLRRIGSELKLGFSTAAQMIKSAPRMLKAKRRKIESPGLSIKEIKLIHNRLPFSGRELRTLRHSWQVLVERGFRLAPLPLNALDARVRDLEKWCKEGLYFVSSLDRGSGLVIVKSGGILRRLSTRYACYHSDDGIHFHPAGKTSSLTLPIMKFATRRGSKSKF